MGLWDNIKNIMTIPEDDEDYEEENRTERSYDDYDKEDYEPAPSKREREREREREKSESPRIIRRNVAAQKAQTAGAPAQMQVVLVKPDRFDDVTGIADHLNAGRTVVLNLEEADRDVARRIVDFLSGAAYANGGNMRKVAKSTFIIAARGVDVAGELMLDELDENRTYY